MSKTCVHVWNAHGYCQWCLADKKHADYLALAEELRAAQLREIDLVATIAYLKAKCHALQVKQQPQAVTCMTTGRIDAKTGKILAKRWHWSCCLCGKEVSTDDPNYKLEHNDGCLLSEKLGA